MAAQANNKVTIEDYIKEAICDWLLDNNCLYDMRWQADIEVKNGNVKVQTMIQPEFEKDDKD